MNKSIFVHAFSLSSAFMFICCMPVYLLNLKRSAIRQKFIHKVKEYTLHKQQKHQQQHSNEKENEQQQQQKIAKLILQPIVTNPRKISALFFCNQILYSFFLECPMYMGIVRYIYTMVVDLIYFGMFSLFPFLSFHLHMSVSSFSLILLCMQFCTMWDT